MKQLFTKQYIMHNKGCYKARQVSALPFTEKGDISLKDLYNAIPIKDFFWFLVNKCDLTLQEKRLFAAYCVEQVLPIHESEHPDDKTVRECVTAIKAYLSGEIKIGELRNKRATVGTLGNLLPAAAAYAADATIDDDGVTPYNLVHAVSYAYAVASIAHTADAYEESIWKFIQTLQK